MLLLRVLFILSAFVLDRPVFPLPGKNLQKTGLPAKAPALGIKTTGAIPSKSKAQNKKSSLFAKTNSTFQSWGVDPTFKSSWINHHKAWSTFVKKKEIVVAIIDTGIDFNHKYLKGNIHVSEGIPGKSNFGKDFSTMPTKSKRNPSNAAPVDNHGHGTHVAGILKSVFPEVKILPIKYYNPKRSGQENLKSLTQSFEYAIRARVDIINYSGGGPEPSVRELQLLKDAQRKGILVIAAAGNEGANIDQKTHAFYPASYGLSNIVTVMAHDKELSILSSSNWGKRSVDISAPGHRILSSVPHNSSARMTGTSQATAFVSGVAALIKSQYPHFSPHDIKIILRRSAQRVKAFKGKSVTEGKLDAAKALTVAKEYNGKPGKPKSSKRGQKLVEAR
ncbi:MAG: S8 family serine peptidase [Bacteriovoracales bacterium]|nr:S8 family serine peptidase [Bacteriovoracales bacterium]